MALPEPLTDTEKAALRESTLYVAIVKAKTVRNEMALKVNLEGNRQKITVIQQDIAQLRQQMTEWQTREQLQASHSQLQQLQLKSRH